MAPAKTDPGYLLWDSENSMIMTWFVNTMEPKIG